MNINVGVSNRHVHLCKNDLDILFGCDLTKKNDLSQDGEFACNEKVSLKTKKNIIDNVRIVGPIRDYTQVEISKTDSYFLGLNPPIRMSGDLSNSETITIIGPNGEIDKENCCIIPARHIHINSNDNCLLANEVVSVKILGEKGGQLDNVIVKKSDGYNFELHIDTDDANAFLLKTGNSVEIIK